MVVGLVPAAGASRRMGTDKRRLPLGDATVLETTVASLRDGGIDRVVVVLEPASPCRDLPGLKDVIVATNPSPQEGMLSSIWAGLDALPDDARAAALLPGDHPFVPPEAVAKLLAHFARHEPPLLAPRYGDRRGHPLIIHRDLFSEAKTCDPSVGLRQLVHRRADDVVELPMEHRHAEQDLDTPQDYVHARRE